MIESNPENTTGITRMDLQRAMAHEASGYQESAVDMGLVVRVVGKRATGSISIEFMADGTADIKVVTVEEKT